MNIQVFAEIARIKKPSKAALVTCQMLCNFVIIMRDLLSIGKAKEQLASQDSINQFQEWSQIQAFICTNTSKFTQDVLQIK